MSGPSALICTRLIDMTVMHPDEDDTHRCHECGHYVGIYPTGQRALAEWPDTPIVCSVCMPVDEIQQSFFAGTVEEIVQEAKDSKPVGEA